MSTFSPSARPGQGPFSKQASLIQALFHCLSAVARACYTLTHTSLHSFLGWPLSALNLPHSMLPPMSWRLVCLWSPAWRPRNPLWSSLEPESTLTSLSSSKRKRSSAGYWVRAGTETCPPAASALREGSLSHLSPLLCAPHWR